MLKRYGEIIEPWETPAFDLNNKDPNLIVFLE